LMRTSFNFARQRVGVLTVFAFIIGQHRQRVFDRLSTSVSITVTGHEVNYSIALRMILSRPASRAA
jgi:hypothetical protein